MPETKSTEKFDIQDETKITITLPSTAYFVSGIRDFTLNLIKNTSDFPEKWAFRFQSVIDELCNNAIEYGSSAGSEIRVVFFIKKGDFIQVSVEDTGTGKEKMKAKTLEDLFSERRAQDYVFTGIRGRGLAKIVGEWTDEVKFEDRTDGGIKITVKKYLKDSRLETKTQQAGINNTEQKTETLQLQ